MYGVLMAPTPRGIRNPEPSEVRGWQDLAASHERTVGTVPVDGEVPPHRPQVAILTCADARVSPARLFDLPAGSLFVVRVAGNIASAEAVASLTYAVEHLGVTTLVVLGHTHCGAVGAAMEGGTDPALEPLVAPIRPAVVGACPDMACAVPANVAATVTALHADPGPLGAALRDGRVAVHGAIVDIADQSLTHLPVPVPTP
jgi:carbonic anhydrase